MLENAILKSRCKVSENPRTLHTCQDLNKWSYCCHSKRVQGNVAVQWTKIATTSIQKQSVAIESKLQSLRLRFPRKMTLLKLRKTLNEQISKTEVIHSNGHLYTNTTSRKAKTRKLKGYKCCSTRMFHLDNISLVPYCP